MASDVLRQFIYAHHCASAVLTGIGYDEPNIYPNFSPDAPQGDLFLVLKWGVTTRGVGVANQVNLQCWAYNRQPNFKPIADALKEIRATLPELVGARMSPTEAILGVNYTGDSDDLYDDGYRAHFRYTSHTITASGS
jgi:hypothetical protein